MRAGTKARAAERQVSTVDGQIALGRSISERRRRYGWSQPELASMLGRPAAWLSQLERGLIPAEPLPVPGALAVTPLAFQVFGSEHDLGDANSSGYASALRDVLFDETRRPGSAILGDRSPSVLSSMAARIWALTTAQEYGELAELLGCLIPELEAAVRDDDDQERADLHELIAISFQACSAALARLGEPDGALIAADRALAAAHRAGDLLLAAGSAYMLVRILLEVRRHHQAEAIAAAAAEALQRPGSANTAEALSLCGALALLRALAAARLGSATGAELHLSRARAIADRLSHDAGNASAIARCRSFFGPDHVALYEIAVSIETSAQLRASRAEH
jgi:transcriptional regulator with XRE-family HTH domain